MMAFSSTASMMCATKIKYWSEKEELIRTIKIEDQLALFKVKSVIQAFPEYEFANKEKRREIVIQVEKRETQRRKIIEYHDNAFE